MEIINISKCFEMQIEVVSIVQQVLFAVVIGKCLVVESCILKGSESSIEIEISLGWKREVVVGVGLEV